MSATRLRPPLLTITTETSAGSLAWRERIAVRLAPVAVGLACWIYSLATLRLGSIGLYGLLASVDPLFFVGLALIVAGFAAELARQERSFAVLVFYLVAVVAVINATVPLLYHAPEYAWVYKHVGVAQSLRVHGRVTDPSDIYQEWPALFAAVAGISSLSGVNPLSFAQWAPLFFELANCLMLLAIFRTLTRDDRVPFLGVLLFEGLVSWVGQDYLSPQAFAFLLWLGLVLLILRWLCAYTPADPEDGPLKQLRGRLLRGFEQPEEAPARARRIAVPLAVGVFFVVVVAHQLTPYMGLAGVAGLTALGLVRPRWLLVILAAVAGGFVLSRYHLLSSEYGGLFSGFNAVENASGAVKTWGSAPQAFTATVVRALALGMWLITFLIVLRSWRRPGRVAIPAVLAGSPFVILFVQSYGGEAIYRVFLFSAPWCAFMIARAIIELRWSPVRLVASAVLPAAALLAGMQGLYGPLTVNAFTPAELSVSRAYYAHAPANSTLVLAVDDFPSSETASYDRFRTVVMPSDPQLGEDWLNAANLPEVNRWAASLAHGGNVYLAVSATMASYTAYYGFPDGYGSLAKALPSSPDWTVYLRSRGAAIYRFTPRN